MNQPKRKSEKNTSLRTVAHDWMAPVKGELPCGVDHQLIRSRNPPPSMYRGNLHRFNNQGELT